MCADAIVVRTAATWTAAVVASDSRGTDVAKSDIGTVRGERRTSRGQNIRGPIPHAGYFFFNRQFNADGARSKGFCYTIDRVIKWITLHPSQVNAPKWKPAAGSPHTRHSWLIWKKKKTSVRLKNVSGDETLYTRKMYIIYIYINGQFKFSNV